MDVSRPLIFIEPYSESLEKLKEATEEIAEDESFDIYEVEELSEVGQLLPTVGPALLISANPKKCAMILQANRRVIAKNRSKVILLSQKRIPEKTLQKFMKIGLSECIVEPVVPKTLMYKVKLLIRSLPNLDKETEEEVVVKAMEAKAAEEDAARRLERGVQGEEEGEEGEEETEDGEKKEKTYREDALSDLYGKREKTENGETLSSYYKGSMKKREGEEGYEEEEEQKSKYTEEIDSYYRGETEGIELDLEEGEKKDTERESFEEDDEVDLQQLKEELTLDIKPADKEEEEQSTEKIDKYYRGESEAIELDLEEGSTKEKSSAASEEEDDDLMFLESSGELEVEEAEETPDEEEELDIFADDEDEEEKAEKDVELELIAPKKSPLAKQEEDYEEEERNSDEDIDLELISEDQLEEIQKKEEEEQEGNLSGQGTVDRLESRMSSSLDTSQMKIEEEDGMRLKQLQNGEEPLDELEDDIEEEPLMELAKPKKDRSTLEKPEEEESEEEEEELDLLQSEARDTDDAEGKEKDIELELEISAPAPMKPQKEEDDDGSLEPLEKDVDLQLEPGKQSREMQKQQEKDFQRTKSLEDHLLELEKDKDGKIKNHGVDHISTYYGLKKPLSGRKKGGDWEKQKRGETLEGYKREKKEGDNVLDFSHEKTQAAEEQGLDEDGNLQAAEVLDYSKKSTDDGDKSLQYADSDLGEQVIDYKKIKEDFELMGDVIGPRKTKTISIVDNTQSSEEYDVTGKKVESEEEKQKTLMDISAPVLEGEELPQEEVEEEEEEEATKVYVPDSKGLEFAIEALDYYQNSKKREEDIFHYIGNAIFKSQKGVTTFFQRDRQTGEVKEIFRGHREFGPHDEMGERIDAWEEIKKERLTTWTTMSLPTWSDSTFQEEHIEFFYPLIVGNEKMGFAIVTFEEGFKEENCKRVEVMLEVTRGLYLENFYKENRSDASYGDQKTEQPDESKKAKGFFKGLFKKKAG